ncbi:MAG: thioesterase family protein [Myxococcales bacterium]|nr:thioesterase family protein [Myxococcales bacterium]
MLAGAPAPVLADDGTLHASYDPSWNQGPGTFGGLLAAALGSAASQRFPDMPVRALSMHLCAATPPGPITIELEQQREGSRTRFLSGRILADGQPTVLATLTLGRPRAEDVVLESPAPPVLPEPTSIGDIFELLGGAMPGVPVFTKHFDFRFAEGMPFTGQRQAVSRGWIRPRTPTPRSPELILALLDTWPLAILSTFPRPRPASSVVIHMQLFPPWPAGPPDAFYAVDMVSDTGRDGYADQRTSLYDAQGCLLGRATQLVAVIR